MCKKIFRIAAGWPLLMLVSGAVAWGQEPETEEPPADDRPVIEDEIEVTAQRIEESLQDVPISIVAVRGEDIEEQAVTEIHGLADLAPGVIVSGQSSTTGEVAVYIRGVGSNTSGLGSESTIAYYVDGIYMPRPQSFLGTFLDLERAEILRGPHAALWGRNSTGGTINLVTRAPESAFHATARVSRGRFDSPQGAASDRSSLSLTGPLTPKLWGRFSASRTRVEDPAWNEYLAAGSRNLDGVAGRAALTVLATDTLTFNLRADGTDDGSRHNFSLKPGDVSRHSIVGSLIRFYNLPASPRDVHLVASNELPTSEFQEEGISLHVDKTFRAGALHLTSISSLREFNSSRRADRDGGALVFADTLGDYDSKWWSHEVYLEGSKDRARWLVGLFGMKEKGWHLTSARTDPGLIGTSIVLSLAPFVGLDPETFCSVADPTLCGPEFYEAVAPAFGLPLTGTLETTNKFDTFLESSSYAAYGQIALALGNRLTFTTGLRYSENDKDFFLATLDPEQVDSSFDLDPEAPSGDGSGLRSYGLDSWRRVTPKLGLEFRPRDNLMLYAVSTVAYKSGGFNAVSFQPTFAPELVESHEIGFKVSSPRGLVLNASAFSYDYDDLQVEMLHIDRSYVENAAAARIRGIDLDLQVRPNSRLGFDVSMEFLDDRFERFESFDPVAVARLAEASQTVFLVLGLVPTYGYGLLFDVAATMEELTERATQRVDVSGAGLSRAPDLSARAAVRYSFGLGKRGELTARGEYQYTDAVGFDAFERFVQPAYGLVHGNLRWSSPKNTFWVNVYGRNLTDKEYRLSEFYTNYIPSLRLWAPPREVGVQLGFDF